MLLQVLISNIRVWYCLKLGSVEVVNPSIVVQVTGTLTISCLQSDNTNQISIANMEYPLLPN